MSTNQTNCAAWFAPFGERCRAIGGAVDAVRQLADDGLRLGLVSNVPLPGDLYRRILRRHDLEASFEVFRFSYDSGHRKPSPFMLRSALGEMGVGPEAAVMVGDRRASDVAAGRAAGVRTIWLRSSHVDGPEPDWTIESLEELPDLLAGTLSGTAE